MYPFVADIRHLLLQLPHHLRYDVCVRRLVEHVKELKGVLLGIEELPLLFLASKGRAWEAKAFIVPEVKGQLGEENALWTGSAHTSRSVCTACL